METTSGGVDKTFLAKLASGIKGGHSHPWWFWCWAPKLGRHPLGGGLPNPGCWRLALRAALYNLLLYFLRLGSRGFSGSWGGWTMGGGGTKAGLPGRMPACLLRCAMRVLAPF